MRMVDQVAINQGIEGVNETNYEEQRPRKRRGNARNRRVVEE
jgi:hypothetical protein